MCCHLPRERVNTPARPQSPRQARRRLPRRARPSSESAEGSAHRHLAAAPAQGSCSPPPRSSGSRAAAGPLPGPGRSPRAARPAGLARRPLPWPARQPAGLRRPEFTSEARPRAAGSARRARPPVSAGTSPPPAAAGDEGGRGRKARAREGRGRVYWLRAPPPAPPTAAAERRVAVRAAAVATNATGNECKAAPRLSGGQTSFGLEHPERHRTRK